MDLFRNAFDRFILNLTRPDLSTAAIFASCLSLFYAYDRYFISTLLRTPRLPGPPSSSLIFGVTRDLFNALDIGVLYHAWENLYGKVYEIPASLGSRMIVIGDPTAISHVFSKDTYSYHQSTITKMLRQRTYGDVLVVMEGDAHKRQRRVLSNSFSISAIRNLTSVFFDSANKLTAAWDAALNSQSKDQGAVKIDVQKWMSHVSIDCLGNSGFSHDFGALGGEHHPIVTALDAFDTVQPSYAILASFLLGIRFPSFFSKIPSQRQDVLRNLVKSIRGIAGVWLEKADKARESKEVAKEVDKSIIGILAKSEHASSNMQLSIEEIMAQINLLIVAGYETVTVGLTWALIELAHHPDVQAKLRAELLAHYPSEDDRQPTYDELVNNLPYLDAFICEILRLRSPVQEVTRVVTEDDTIPLAQPIRTSSGTLIDSLYVSKGTKIRLPIVGVNRSLTLWGADAEVFDPTRWLVEGDLNGDRNREDAELKARRETVQGYRHLLSFGYGPRMCLGRNFALAELKAVLSVLIRRYTFELPHGTDMKLESHFVILRRPKLVGEEGPRVPLVVRRAE